MPRKYDTNAIPNVFAKSAEELHQSANSWWSLDKQNLKCFRHKWANLEEWAMFRQKSEELQLLSDLFVDSTFTLSWCEFRLSTLKSAPSWRCIERLMQCITYIIYNLTATIWPYLHHGTTICLHFTVCNLLLPPSLKLNCQDKVSE
jgi:hypothetical protein